ncbi:MAG: hypothetical protein JWO36_7522 [Myxococcales bacterium]|nr:hypothetical protein [Myxococcales bacterium]
MRWMFVLAFAAGCGNSPPFALRFRLTQGKTEACITQAGGVQATTCDQITMPCEAVVSIRIVPPGDPTVPYISLCKTLSRRDVCGIAGVTLPQPASPVPEQRLLVQMAVYPRFKLPTDMATGDPLCPANVAYAADGFPVTQDLPCDNTVTDPDLADFCWPTPAIGGTAYYTPGDPETIVDLGCSNLDAFMDPICVSKQDTIVTASVSDFDTPGFSVSQGVADLLSISVGEPKPLASAFALNVADVVPLPRFGIVPPSWSGHVSLPLVQSACLEIKDETPQSTSTIACRKLQSPMHDTLDVPGVRLSKQSLDQIIKTINTEQATTLPPFTLDKGLVVGIVLDNLGNPVANNVVVTDVPGTIEYLSADRTHFVTGGTSSSGIFLSKDIPYGTNFTTVGSAAATATGFGGLVNNKVSIVQLQFSLPIGN